MGGGGGGGQFLEMRFLTEHCWIYWQVSTTSCPTSTPSTSSSFSFTVSAVTMLSAGRSMVHAGIGIVSVCDTGSSPMCTEPSCTERSSAMLPPRHFVSMLQDVCHQEFTRIFFFFFFFFVRVFLHHVLRGVYKLRVLQSCVSKTAVCECCSFCH